jgi:uncharacterized protein (TIGR03067 family)
MCRRLICVLAALSFTVVIGVAGEQSANNVKDLQGTWQAVEIEGNGEKAPAEQVRELKVVIEGDMLYAVKPQGEDPKNKFKIDATKKPQTIDLFPVDGDRKGQQIAGIYSLENGQLRICINLFGKDTTQRPTTFKTQEGTGVACVILERAKK